MRTLSSGVTFLAGLLPPLLAAVTPRAKKALIGAKSARVAGEMMGSAENS